MARPLSIHIVDDDRDLCRALGNWLEAAGHRVSWLPAHPSAVSEIVARGPDLVLLGVPRYASPGMELYRRLSTNRATRNLPVIAVSEDGSLEYELLDVFDFQVPPFDRERLFAALDRLGKTRQAPPLQIDPAHLTRFKDYLRAHSALHFSQRNQRMLERGLLRRIQALQMPSAEAYYAYLQAAAENFDELNKLLRFLTVGETCFFRYRSHRDALLHYVLPRLIDRRRKQRRLRIWSAGCSTGEEPYSLAILLLEHFPELQDWNLQIVATDINKRALRQAREGIYGARTLRLMEPALRERYFEEVGPYFRIGPLVRSMVRFNYLNLQSDAFPDPANQTDAVDLLFCRNVLIYFELETIRRIVGQFAECLTESSFLFLGHAETMQNVSDRFQRVHEQGAFFYRLKPEPAAASPKPVKVAVPVLPKSVPAPTPAPLASARSSAAASAPPPASFPRHAERLYAAAMDAFDHEKFAEAEALLDQSLVARPNHPPSLVGKGLLRANHGDYAEARRYCARAIAEDDLLPEAYLLRGLILDMEGYLERALVEYQKVLWLDHSFTMAHYLMAKVYARLGQSAQASRALRNTLRCLERSPNRPSIPFSGGLSRGVFLDIVHRELAATR